MPRTSDKRERLLDAAKHLIHTQGFGPTTLSDIARESGVPLGNVYYYFKTKDEIGAAVVDERRLEFRRLLETVEAQSPDPRVRLLAMLDFVRGIVDALVAHGCPIGGLCQELEKDGGPLAERADGLLKLQVEWATGEFRRLGRGDAEALGVHLIAALQGLTLVGHALHDPGAMNDQLDRLEAWIRAL